MSLSDEDNTGDALRRKQQHLRCGTPIYGPEPTFHGTSHDLIGRDLRALYEALRLEPLPPRILDLVSRLHSTPTRTLQ